MITLDITSTIDKFYTYRTALIEASIWIALEEREIRILSNYLKSQGYNLSNHICWKNKDGMCFMYSDRQLGLGTEIIEKRW